MGLLFGRRAREGERQPRRRTSRPSPPRGGRPPVRRKKKKEAEAARPRVPAPNRRSTPTPEGPEAEQGSQGVARLRGIGARLRRPVLVTVKVAVVIAVAAGAVAGARLVERHVRSAPAFALHTVSVQGTDRLTEQQVLETAGVEVGQNAFDVSPEEARDRLLRHPWIAQADVRRQLPDTFEITIHERSAVAILSLGSLYLVGEDGTVFKRVEDGDDVDLPVITGVNRARFTTDRAYRASIVLTVVALLHDYRGAGLWRREPIAEVHVEDDDGLSLYIGDDATYVRLGRGPFREKLRRLRTILDRLKREESRAMYVYLDNVRRPDRVTVRLR